MLDLSKSTDPDLRTALIRKALTPHQDHEISINGCITNVPPLVHRTDEQLAWRFLGYAVRCLRCMTSLSEEWNG